MNHVDLTIAGRNYSLQTTAEPEYARKLAKELEQTARELMRQNGALSFSDACILMSLDLLERLDQERATNDNLRSEAQEYILRARAADAEAAELRKKMAMLETAAKSKK